MSGVHIPEEEAIRDFGAVLAKVDAGDEVVIDRANVPVKVIPSRPAFRTVADALAILKARGDEGVMDEEFARDVRNFRERHRESFHASTSD
jgi:antitoxin (DNA-binding transcriptional repressor) of toxin-antitoxin stability system